LGTEPPPTYQVLTVADGATASGSAFHSGQGQSARDPPSALGPRSSRWIIDCELQPISDKATSQALMARRECTPCARDPPLSRGGACGSGRIRTLTEVL